MCEGMGRIKQALGKIVAIEEKKITEITEDVPTLDDDFGLQLL